MSRRWVAVLAMLVAVWMTGPAGAQVVVPVDYDGLGWECWSVLNRTVDMVVRDQVASVSVTDEIRNPCPQAVEVEYLFPLPLGAAIDRMTLEMNGQEISGRILDAQTARMIYEEIVRGKRDPGLLEYAGYGLFRSSAFPLSGGQSARMTIHYTMTCRKDGDLVEVFYPMSTGHYPVEPIGHFRLRCDIESGVDITTIYSPSVDIEVEQASPERAIVTYETGGFRPIADFDLFYAASREQVGATLLTYWPNPDEAGYYLMLVSPSPRCEGETTMPKDVVVVLDRSGSMSGSKIQQARDAARYVIENLNPADRFNFIVYNDSPELCFPELREVSEENVQRALARLERMDAHGSTNIHRALEMAMQQCESSQLAGEVGTTRERPAYVIFLTDGLPTAGNTNELEILANTYQANHADARLFAFGVGYDVNVRLLDKLVEQNQGRSAFVKPNESIEGKVSSLYNRIRNPFMTDVQAEIANFDTHDDSPAELGDLFEGDQILRAGRIYPVAKATGDGKREPARTTLAVSGTVRGEPRRFEYPVVVDMDGDGSPYEFVAKLWAVRRVGELLNDIQLHGQVEELVDELIRLATRYGIVTPYTSFLADEGQNFSDAREIRSLVKRQAGFKADQVTGPQAQMDAVAREQAIEYKAPAQASSAEGYAMRMGASSQEAYESGRTEEVKTIRIVGSETLYKRGDTWQTAGTLELDVKRDQSRIRKVQRFSDEYFALARAATPQESKVLAAQREHEKLLIRLQGDVYWIE